MTTFYHEREMELLAECVRERLWKDPDLALLRAAQVPVMFGYADTAVWLQVGGRTASRVAWIRWWESGPNSRKDHAARVAQRLVMEWRGGRRS